MVCTSFIVVQHLYSFHRSTCFHPQYFLSLVLHLVFFGLAGSLGYSMQSEMYCPREAAYSLCDFHQDVQVAMRFLLATFIRHWLGTKCTTICSENQVQHGYVQEDDEDPKHHLMSVAF